MAQQYKRRLIPIVDRTFQFKYTGIIVAIAAIVSAVLGYFLLTSYWEMNEVIGLASMSPDVNERLNSDDAKKVFRITFGFLIAEVAILGVMGLLITHRVVGPIFVLHRHLTTLVEGNYPSPRPLRSGDEFKSTFDLFTTFVNNLKKQNDDEHDKLQALHAAAKAKGVPEAELKALEAMIAERAARRSNRPTTPPASPTS